MRRIFFLCAFLVFLRSAEARTYPLRFEGFNPNSFPKIKKNFGGFDHEWAQSEVDELLRQLMLTGQFSRVEVTKNPETNELTVVGLSYKKIESINISGNKALSDQEISNILKIQKKQVLIRKNLAQQAQELQNTYSRMGLLNSKIEIEFENGSNADGIRVNVKVQEGASCQLLSIHIESPNSVVAKDLKRKAKSFENEILNDGRLLEFQKLAAEYFAENRFLLAHLSQPTIAYNADRSQAKVTYLVENPYRFDLYYYGRHQLDESDLFPNLELEKLTGISSNPSADLSDQVLKIYKKMGYTNATVYYSEQTFEQEFIKRVKIKINEGPRVKIKEFNVTGLISRPPASYSEFIIKNSSSIVRMGYYNKQDLDTGLEALMTDLQNRGYLQAKLQPLRTELSKDQKYAKVFLEIDEGPITQTRQIRLDGVKAFGRSTLLDTLDFHSNSPLSPKGLEEGLKKIKALYLENGYLEMRITNENDNVVTYNDTHTAADIYLRIDEGPKVIINSILFEGLETTKEEVVTRELPIARGEVLTPDKIAETTRVLMNMRLFSQVEVRTLEEGTKNAERTLVIKVSEAKPGTFVSGVGVFQQQRATGYRGFIGLGYRNLGGSARAISGRVEFNYSLNPEIEYLELNKETLSYYEPYVFGAKNRGRASYTREQKYFEMDAEKGSVFSEDNTFDFTLERDLSKHLKMTYTLWSFSNQKKYAKRGLENLETQNIARIGPLFELDYRDNQFVPTKGSYCQLNFEYSDPLFGSSKNDPYTIHFFKSTANYTHYWQPVKTTAVVWANSIRAGYLKNLSHDANSGVPASQAFFLGGRTTIRGFDSSKDIEKIPNISQLQVAKLRYFKVTNESEFYLLKSEFRIPIFDQFQFAVFYDGGSVLFTQPEIIIPDRYRDSIGIGARLITPFGPIAADIAFKLDRDPSEEPLAFYLSFGTF